MTLGDKVRTALAICMFISGLAQAQEPLTFKGFELGADKEAFLAALPKLGRPCEAGKFSPNTTFCYWRTETACRGHDYEQCRNLMSYGGVMPASIMAGFKDDKLVSASLTFDSESFKDLSAVMVERFGKPDKDEPSVVQNRAGATFENRELRWHRGDANLSIKMRAGKVDQGSMFFVSRKYINEQAEERAKDTKSRAKDL
jgi:hypothetical protein